jgi:hypothetical protein
MARKATAKDRAMLLDVRARLLRAMDRAGIPRPPTFDPAERAREKQASRDQDAHDIATGVRTVEQVRRDNGAFAFPRERIRLTRPKRG